MGSVAAQHCIACYSTLAKVPISIVSDPYYARLCGVMGHSIVIVS